MNVSEVIQFPEPSRDDLYRLAAEAEIRVEDAQKALDVAKGIRMYYIRKLGLIALEDE